jgi:hypothetical protein
MAVQFGFVDLEHLWDRPVADAGYPVVRDAINRTVAFYNNRFNRMSGSLAQTTVLAQERFLMPGAGSFQDIDEDSNPLPTIQYEGYDVGYPIRGGGDAMGTNRLSRAMMTVEDANDKTRAAQVMDRNFNINHMLAALLTKDSYTWLDRTRLGYTGAGSLTIQPLANGDATTYIATQGGTIATDNHYLGQAAAIADAANPFPSIYNDLKEHLDSGDPDVDVYVPDNLTASIAALTNFVEVADPNIRLASDERQLTAQIPTNFGDLALGRVDRCNIILWGKLPSNYMLAVVRGNPPLAMRQYPVGGFQGLFTEDNNVDGNHLETRFLRFCGYGVRNRTSALAYFIGSGTYANPANYTAPLRGA